MSEARKMRKTDELLLLGDVEGAAKNELRNVRSIRTQAQHALQVLDAGVVEFPDKTDAEMSHAREVFEQAVAQADRHEAFWLELLADPTLIE